MTCASQAQGISSFRMASCPTRPPSPSIDRRCAPCPARLRAGAQSRGRQRSRAPFAHLRPPSPRVAAALSPLFLRRVCPADHLKVGMLLRIAAARVNGALRPTLRCGLSPVGSPAPLQDSLAALCPSPPGATSSHFTNAEPPPQRSVIPHCAPHGEPALPDV